MRKRLLASLLLLIAIGIVSCRSGDERDDDQGKNVDLTCARCHTSYTEEYRLSAMSGSSNAKPIAAAFDHYAKVLGDQQIAGCTQCHNPDAFPHRGAAAVRGAPAATTPGHCDFCHRTTSVVQERFGQGAGAYELGAEGLFLSPEHGTIPTTAHASGINLKLRDTTMCYGCHWEHRNLQGVIVCRTGSEHAQFRQITGFTLSCQNCHMQKAEGPIAIQSRITRSRNIHAMVGARGETMHRRAAVLTVQSQPRSKGEKFVIDVAISNQTGHGLPTGSPMRVLAVKVQALNAGGDLIWENYPDDVYERDPQALLRVIYVDVENRQISDAWMAAGIAEDTRLQPAEVRLMRFSVPERFEDSLSLVVVHLDLYLYDNAWTRTIGDPPLPAINRFRLISASMRIDK